MFFSFDDVELTDDNYSDDNVPSDDFGKPNDED